MSKDSKSKTLLIAFILAITCSILVSGAAVFLRPMQDANRVNDRNKNVLSAAGLYQPNVAVEDQLESIVSKMVDLKTGTFVQGDVDTYFRDFKDITTAEKTSRAIPSESDLAGIRRVANQVPVYLATSDGSIDTYILPVYGQGLWSTLYGFLAVESDGNTVVGLTFYEHGETPGLGGEIDNPLWKKKWNGKQLFDEQGVPVIEIVKGVVETIDPKASHRVDGLSGATLTSRGVDQLIRFWVGDDGFGLFLKNIQNGSILKGKGE